MHSPHALCWIEVKIRASAHHVEGVATHDTQRTCRALITDNHHHAAIFVI